MQSLVIRMSRIGSKLLLLPSDVKITIAESTATVMGPKGTLALTIAHGVNVRQEEGGIVIETTQGNLQGLTRALIANAIVGVKTGWSKQLELVGVGFKATATANELTLNLGFSHPVKIVAAKDTAFIVSENKITVTGIDKYLVGELAAQIRRIKPPEPYKGKGIRYTGEVIRKKLGKAAKATGAVGAK